MRHRLVVLNSGKELILLKKNEASFEKLKTVIISVVVAIVLWVAITNVVNPDVTETVYNIPIQANGMVALREKRLVMINSDSLPTCNVKIVGKRRDIIESRDKITAVANVSEINGSGEIETLVAINAPASLKIEKQSIKTVVAEIENGVEKQIPISIEQKNVPYDKVVESKPENKSITIFGSIKDVDSISGCRVVTDLAGVSNHTKSMYPFVYLSSDNKEIAKPKSIYSSSVNVLIGHTVYDKLELPVAVNINEEIYKEFRVDTKSLENKIIACGVAADYPIPGKIEYNLQEVSEGENNIDLLNAVYNQGIYIPDEDRYIKLSAKRLKSESVPVSVSAYNVKEGYEIAEIATQESYVITGTEDELKDVKGKVNVENLEDGTYSLPIEFENENIKNQYNVTVTIKRKGA